MAENPWLFSHAVSRPLPQPISAVGPGRRNRSSKSCRSTGGGWVSNLPRTPQLHGHTHAESHHPSAAGLPET